MSALTRRELIRFVTAAWTASAARIPRGAAASAQRPSFRPLPMKITDVEVHEIVPPYQDYNGKHLYRSQALSFQTRAIYVVKTNLGIEGFGETGGGPAPPGKTFANLIGRSPFEEFAGAEHLGISMALYDLMGKYLGVPVWRLLGPQVRTWIPLSAWTMSQTPAGMAAEAARFSRLGYGWLKFHVDVFQNAVDQTEAVQRAAPELRLHYDFNGDESAAVVLPTLKELEKFSAAGRVEDPIRGDKPADLDEWRLLRRKTSLPLLASVKFGPEYLVEKAADGCVLSRGAVPEAIRVSSLAEAANTPFMLQHVGGNLTLAFLAHEASVFRMATVDHVNCCHIWKDDVTVERLPVVGGRVRVPEGPGLGVALDRDKLTHYAAAPRPKRDRFLARMRYRNGLTVYMRFPEDPYQSSFAGYGKDGVDRHLPGTGPMYRKPVVTDFWDETGSPEFERIWALTASRAYWTEGGAGSSR